VAAGRQRVVPRGGGVRQIDSAKPSQLTIGGDNDSLLRMTRDQALRARQKLLGKLPVTDELLRGSLLDRLVRHSSGCPKCARGGGHPVSVLTVSYPGGRTRQFGIPREQVSEVRRWLANYQELKRAIEEICELNHGLLRPDDAARKPGRKRND
jgi:hypothetical protein